MVFNRYMDRRSALAASRLYLITPSWFLDDGGDALASVIAAGVDMVQLRDKHAEAAPILGAAKTAKQVCEGKSLLIINDRVDLTIAAAADGVHLGQGDIPVEAARRLLGPELLIGLSAHSEQEVLGVPSETDYIGVGPVFSTPTKAGRPGVGLGLVTFAAANAKVPFFAIGGIDKFSAPAVIEAGASRLSVLRAITDDPDPAAAAQLLRDALTG